MKQKLGSITLAVLMLSSSPLMAMTDQEIEAKFQQYEARIKALESDLAKKPTPVYEENLARSAAPVSAQSAADSKLKINGFITAGATVANEDINSYGLESTVNARGLSKAGLQLSYQLNDKADATIQMVARTSDSGDDVWSVDAEWAYLGYQITDDLKVRAGRLRIPFYMYSESLDVGYSYPWVRPPLDVYRSPLTAYDGIDLLYGFKTGPINNRAQLWMGSYKDTSGTDNLLLKDQFGLNLSSTWGDFTARAMAFTIAIDGTSTGTLTDDTLINLPGPFPPAAPNGVYCTGAPPFFQPIPGLTSCSYTTGTNNGAPADFYTYTVEAEDKLDYSSVGLQWDNGQFFVITETTDLRSEKGLFFTDQKSGYISGGMRIQDWTPYASYGWAYSYNEKDYVNAFGTGSIVCIGQTTAQGCSSSSKSVSLGVRKELGENIAMKFQTDHYYDFNGSNGFFGFSSGQGWNNADVYTLSLDAVF